MFSNRNESFIIESLSEKDEANSRLHFHKTAAYIQYFEPWKFDWETTGKNNVFSIFYFLCFGRQFWERQWITLKEILWYPFKFHGNLMVTTPRSMCECERVAVRYFGAKQKPRPLGYSKTISTHQKYNKTIQLLHRCMVAVFFIHFV